MKRCFIILAVSAPLALDAQSNQIFFGGAGDGYSVFGVQQSTLLHNQGGSGDGEGSIAYQQSIINNNAGGAGDGWYRMNYLQVVATTNSGGTGDGWHSHNYQQTVTNSYVGGAGDGWLFDDKPAFLSAFNKGGQGDGWASTYHPLAPLPITFISFDARKQNAIATLRWLMGEDRDVEKFDVERSADAVHFTHVGTVLQSQLANKTYMFADVDPIQGHNYYRLLVRNKNGKVSYTGVRLVVFEPFVNSGIKVYPNPASSHVFIELLTEKISTPIVTNGYNAGGQLVLHQIFSPGKTMLDINTERLAAGTYFLHVTYDNTSSVAHIVIKK